MIMKKQKKMIAMIIALCMMISNISMQEIYAKGRYSNKNITLYVGALVQEGIGESNITYSVKNTKIADIDSTGFITAKKKGTTKIIVKKNNKKIYHINVKVKRKKGFQISRNSGNVTEGQIVKISAKRGYKVFYTTGKKLKRKQYIKSGKTKQIKITKNTTIYIYVVKNAKKPKIRVINKNLQKKAICYMYTVNKSDNKNATSPDENETLIQINNNSSINVAEDKTEETTVSDNAEKDTDKDGLADYIEEHYGCDIEKEDTDGDGLSDYIEIMVINTDPTLVDSDGNGISDFDEDADEDGLTNGEEVQKGTKLVCKDTDNDGLSDGEEVNNYFTDPLLYDTDGDDASDGWEIENGYNPTVKNSKFSVEKKYDAVGDEKTIPSLTIDGITGEQIESLEINRCEENGVINDDIPGYLGEYYEFKIDGSIKSAQITFEFDESLWKNGLYPVIYYYNESKQLLEKVDNQMIQGNKVCATTTHFSKYLLINQIKFNNLYYGDLEVSNILKNLNIAFVVDASGSMETNDEYENRKQLIAKKINSLSENDKACVISFTHISSLCCPFTNDKNTLLSAISGLGSLGGTAVYDGMQLAISQFKSEPTSLFNQNVILLLTDGYDSVSYTYEMYSALADEARALGIKIYTVGLGDVNKSVLQCLSSGTGGKYSYVTDSTLLADGFQEVQKEIDMTSDSNNDGISDYYTKLMCDGTITDGVGKKVFRDASYDEVQANSDYDGDGLINGQEITIEKDGKGVYVKEKTSPVLEDTDYDGTEDEDDDEPLDNDFNAKLYTYNSEEVNSSVDYNMNYKSFLNNDISFSSDICVVSSILAALVYKKSRLDGYKIDEFMANKIGMSNVERYSLSDESVNTSESSGNMFEYKTIYVDDDVSEVCIGTRKVRDEHGKEKYVICVVVRGTNGTINEWSSNFDIGMSSYGNRHKGFDVTTKRILAFLDDYISYYSLNNVDKCFWVTGHSRGAAIANLLSADLIDKGESAIGYTFAAPATTTADLDEVNSSKYDSIYNVINEDDFVPKLPLSAWGFRLYGKVTVEQSISELYEKEWEKLTNCKTQMGGMIPIGVVDYNNDRYGMESTVESLATIATDRDKCFEYVINDKGYAKSQTYPNYSSLFDDTYMVTGHFFEYKTYQKPIFLMKMLVGVMAEELSAVNFARMDVADYLEEAKWAVIRSNLGGITHPHYTESYYVIAKNVKATDFRNKY